MTARFDPELFDRLDMLRRLHFPPAVNYLPAHLTLFHALPGLQIEQIHRDLRNLNLIAAMTSTGSIESIESIETASIHCLLPSVRFTGRGVQAEVVCEPLNLIRESLVSGWHRWLTNQDRQRFRPHVTIQNKTNPAEARCLFQKLSSSWIPLTGQIIGLDLWHYAGGPWEAAGQYALMRR